MPKAALCKGLADTEIPESSVPVLFDQIAVKYKSRPALIFYGKKIASSELKELIDRMATAPAAFGVKKKDTIALHLRLFLSTMSA